MLIRRQNGSTFHIVRAETHTYYVCLCGARIIKNNPVAQRQADGRYVRCLACRQVEHARLAKCPGLKVF